jgi:hypothetical protein
MQTRSLIHSTEYYLVFTQGITHWITRWLRPDFSHIWLLTKDDFNWILLNPTRGYLQCSILPVPITQSPLPQLVKDGDTVLHITFSKRDCTQQFGSIGLLNCVTWAKYILGVRVNCLTPFGLYKRLINLCPSARKARSILTLKELEHDWSRNAMEQRP